MSTRSVTATEVKPGDVLALPFGKTATVTDVKVGTRFVTLALAEYPKTRVGRHDEVLLIAGGPTTNFMIDEERARAYLGNEGPEMLCIESPARSIETIVVEALDDWASKPDDVDLLLYPLIYDSDADGLLIVLGGGRHVPYVASSPMDWDDVVDIDRGPFGLSAFDRDLTADETIGIVRSVFDHANRLLPALRALTAALPEGVTR